MCNNFSQILFRQKCLLNAYENPETIIMNLFSKCTNGKTNYDFASRFWYVAIVMKIKKQKSICTCFAVDL